MGRDATGGNCYGFICGCDSHVLIWGEYGAPFHVDGHGFVSGEMLAKGNEKVYMKRMEDGRAGCVSANIKWLG